MYDPLRDAWIKYNRAVEHVNSLVSDSLAYADAQPPPYHVQVVFETAVGCHVARFRVTREPDTRLGATVGDIVHNLRSAFDVTAWQLAIAHDEDAAVKDRNAVQFPFAKTPKAFKGHKALPFFSENARGVIEELQPYPGSPWEALGWLPAISNSDKHRVPPSALVGLNLAALGYDADVPIEITILHEPDMALEDGAAIARIIADGPPTTEIRVSGTIAPRIFFATDEGRVGTIGIVAMAKAVESALTELGRAFPRPEQPI